MNEVYSYLAIALTFVGYFPYIHSILKGKTKPHVFSWLIWTITTTVVYFAQVADEGGVGAWPTGASAVITFYITYLAYIKKSDRHISAMDWVFFVSALISLPVWYFTSSPLWAVVILTSVDVMGFAPTFRKAYDSPHEENATFYSLFAFRNIFAVLALENFSVTTLLFPVVTGIACVPLVLMIGSRKKKVQDKRIS